MHILYSVHRFKHCKYVCKPTECVYVCKYVRPTKTVTCDNGQNALSSARCLDRESIQFTDQDLVMSQRVESIPRRTDWMSAVTCLYLVTAIQLRLCILFLCILIISHLRRCKMCIGKKVKKRWPKTVPGFASRNGLKCPTGCQDAWHKSRSWNSLAPEDKA
jgi:hypothetical protein